MNDYSRTEARNIANVFSINHAIKPQFIYDSHFKTKLNSAIYYAGCCRRNLPCFGRKFLRLDYSEITNDAYNRRRKIMETLKKLSLLANARTIPV